MVDAWHSPATRSPVQLEPSRGYLVSAPPIPRRRAKRRTRHPDIYEVICRTLYLAIGCPMLPPRPTRHLPGTKEKARVMQRRRRLGYHLYHPLDACPSLG